VFRSTVAWRMCPNYGGRRGRRQTRGFSPGLGEGTGPEAETGTEEEAAGTETAPSPSRPPPPKAAVGAATAGTVVPASSGCLLQVQLPDLARARSGTFDALEGKWRYTKCFPTAAHRAP
jgi:hypothetical protein